MNSTKRYSILAAAVVLVLLVCCTNSHAATFQPQTTDAATPWTDRPFRNNPQNFQFAIVADRTGGCRPGVFKKAMRQINLLQPEFVISVGDLVEGYIDNHDTDTLKKQYDEVDAILDGLEMRFFRVPGNHDITDDMMLEEYRKRYGSPYYHFVYKDVLFLMICTEDPPRGRLGDAGAGISDTQVSYMKNALQDNKSTRWTLVFMHRPLFEKPGGKLHEGWGKIEDMLKDRPHTVFAGHGHKYVMRKKHGRNYIRLATTGGVSKLSGIAAGAFDHIVWVTMTDQGPRIANLMMDGIHDENVRAGEFKWK